MLYDLCISAGLAFFLVITFHRGTNRAGQSPEEALQHGLFCLAGGFLGGRALYHICHPISIESLWILFRYDHGGFMFHGLILGGIAFQAAFGGWKKKRFLELADVTAPAWACATSFWRIGCLVAGCCRGRPINGAYFLVQGLPAAEAIFFAVLCLRLQNISTESCCGEVFGKFLLGVGAFRLIADPFRGDDLGFQFTHLGIPSTMGFSLLMVLAGLGILLRLRVQVKVQFSDETKHGAWPRE